MFFLVFLFFPGNILSAEKGEVRGRVVDPSGKGLAGVELLLVEDQPLTSETDSEGFFTIHVFREGTFNLLINKVGYFPLFREVRPTPEGELPLYVLSPLPMEPVEVGKGDRVPVMVEALVLMSEQDSDTYYGEGQVKVIYEDAVLTADKAKLNLQTNRGEASGNVVFKSGGDFLEGESLVWNIKEKTGVVENGKVFVLRTHVYVRGDRIEKLSGDTYHVINPKLTTCDGEKPDWKVKGDELKVTLEGYGILKKGVFCAADIPILYSPYLVFPVKTKRQSGFLLPRFSYSRDKLGFDVTVPYFFAISEDKDATLYPRYMSQRGFQTGLEFRYAPSETVKGVIYGDFLNDRKKVKEEVGDISRNWQDPHRRWSFYFHHEQQFDPSLGLRVDVVRVSDPFYFRDFSSYNYFLENYSKDKQQPFKNISFLADETLRLIDSTVRLVKVNPFVNSTILIKRTENLMANSNENTLQRYPEVKITASKTPLFSSFLFGEGTVTYDYFYRQKGQKGHYLDVNPTISLPFDVGDIGSAIAYAGFRASLWSRDDSDKSENSRSGEREVYSTGISIYRDMCRVFDIDGKEIKKLFHVIRPELTYEYTQHFHQRTSLPDYVERVQNTNLIKYGISNTLNAKIIDGKDRFRYDEIFRLKITQTYDVKEAQRDNGEEKPKRPFGEIVMEMDAHPFKYVSFSARNNFNVYEKNLSQANYDASVQDNRGDLVKISYRYTKDKVEQTNLSVKAVMTKELNFNFSARWDHLNDRSVEKIYGIMYSRQCWSLGIDVADRHNDRAFSLKFSIFGL
ncbi:MAG: LPS assembly protein LptD [Syntrophales bacterium]|nr:LPS assembly protein LptD [Syntrophales bacterium]